MQKRKTGVLCSFKGNELLLLLTAVATAVFCHNSSFQCREEPPHCLLAVWYEKGVAKRKRQERRVEVRNTAELDRLVDKKEGHINSEKKTENTWFFGALPMKESLIEGKAVPTHGQQAVVLPCLEERVTEEFPGMG